MTQPHFTLSAEPVAVLANVTGLLTVGTTSPLVFYNLRITGDSHWKVAQEKRMNGNWPTPSSLAAVLPNQLHCQLELVVLDVLDGSVWAEILLQNVRVCNCNIKQEVKNFLLFVLQL